VVEPAAIPVVDLLAHECIESVYDMLRRRGPTSVLAQKFLSVANFYSTEPWRSLMAQNTPATLPPRIPVFLAQGGDDQLVRPPVTQDYMAKLCRAGSKVRMDLVPNSNHGFIGRDSAGAAVQWMADRFAGVPAPSDCSG
jgi:acetyl esterase/lipase